MLGIELRVVDPRDGRIADVTLKFAQASSVGDVADALTGVFGGSGESTIHLRDRTYPPLDPEAEFVSSAVRRGDLVALVPRVSTTPASGGVVADETPDRLVVIDGPQAPAEFVLSPGSNLIGRDGAVCSVSLNDVSVSKVHAEITVSEPVEILDRGSTNKVVVDGVTVLSARLDAGSLIRLGDSLLRFEPGRKLGRGQDVDLRFNRSPRIVAPFRPEVVTFPEAPEKPKPVRFPWVTLAGTLIMAMVMILVMSGRGGGSFAIFYVMSPMLLVAGIFESRRSGGSEFRVAKAEWWESCLESGERLRRLGRAEKDLRRRNAPSSSDLVPQAVRHQARLWEREPKDVDFLALRVGVATLPTSHEIESNLSKGDRDSRDRLAKLIAADQMVEGMPVQVDLRARGALAVVGERSNTESVVRGLLAQVVALQSHSEVVLSALMTREFSGSKWDWLKWLPHLRSAQTVFQGWPVGVDAEDAQQVLSMIEAAIDRRASEQLGSESEPAILVLVDGRIEIERSRMQRVLEAGPPHRVYFIWVDERIEDVPLGCRSVVLLSQSGRSGEVADAETGQRTPDVDLDRLGVGDALEVALALAPVVDANRKVYAAGNLPDGVTLVELMGEPDVLSKPDAIKAWWAGQNMWWGDAQLSASRHGHLNILLGAFDGGNNNRLIVDLRRDGPHALVAGTTGAGKSELLQTIVTSMALTYSPGDVNFLYVDYKGGAAFGKCLRFPHSVGMITDLDTAQVRRVEISLKAELHRREHLLAKYSKYGARDMADLGQLVRESKADAADLPASLIIVVDEFAALRAEIPEFVDGIVDIAARGRSLGMHLILATQNPATSINDNIRSNTNLRIALRVAAPENSSDVLRSPVAAYFPKIPGRGAVRRGAQDVEVFQSAYVGASGEPPRADDVRAVSFDVSGGSGAVVASDLDTVGESDGGQGKGSHLDRLAETLNQAADQLRGSGDLRPIHVPWRPSLPKIVPTLITDRPPPPSAAALYLGLEDIPEDQAYRQRYFDFELEGNLHIFGGSGCGKSSVLRSLALAAGFDRPRSPWNVYVLDFAGQQLGTLARLPYVGAVLVDSDVDRVVRLVLWLEKEIRRREALIAASDAMNLGAWNNQASVDQVLPRVLLLGDGYDSINGFLDKHHRRGDYVEAFRKVCQRGRQVGIHVVLTSTRGNEGDGATRSAMDHKLAMAGPMTLLLDLGVRDGILPSEPPPGRCALDRRHQLQAAVCGKPPPESQDDEVDEIDADVGLSPEEQNDYVEEMAERMTARLGDGALPQVRAAWNIPVFPDDVAVTEFERFGVSATANWIPVGMAHATLEPAYVGLDVPTAVHGPPGSGKTTCLVTLAVGVAKLFPERPVWWFSVGSPDPEAAVNDFTYMSGEELSDGVSRLLEGLADGLFSGTGVTVVFDEISDLVQVERQIDDVLLALIGMLGRIPLTLLVSADIRRFEQASSFRRFKNAGPTGIALGWESGTTYPFFDLMQPPNAVDWMEFPAGRAVLVRRGSTPEIVQVARI